MKVDHAAIRALSGAAPPHNPPCKVCSAPAALFDVVDFLKYCSTENPYAFGLSGIPVHYHRCPDCGFLFTQFMDSWSPADFSRHVYNDEYVLVDPEYTGARSLRMAEFFATIFGRIPDIRVLDYGAGAGIFGERLAALGMPNVVGYDPFASPERPAGGHDVVFASEVIEHSPDPLSTLRDMLSLSGPASVIILTTAFQPQDIERVRAGWWYVGPRNGHVSIFGNESFHAAAEACGLEFFDSCGVPMLARRASDLEALGLPYFQPVKLVLRAPDEPAAAGWQVLEQIGPFRARWIDGPRQSWTFTGKSGPVKVTLEIPVLIEAVPGLAEQQVVTVNGQQVATEVIGLAPFRVICGTIVLESPGAIHVDVASPVMIGPDQRGGDDPRSLGIMLPAGTTRAAGTRRAPDGGSALPGKGTRILIGRHNGIGDLVMAIPFIGGYLELGYDVTVATADPGIRAWLKWLFPAIDAIDCICSPYQDGNQVWPGYDYYLNLNQVEKADALAQASGQVPLNQQSAYLLFARIRELPNPPHGLSPSHYVHHREERTDQVLLFTRSRHASRTLPAEMVERLRGSIPNVVIDPQYDNLIELSRAIASAREVIGVDSGAVHLAEAFSTPWRVLHTTMSFDIRHKFYIHGSAETSLQADIACSPCLRHQGCGDFECTARFDVTRLLDAPLARQEA